jgi:methanogenic corrinoid protein MtbC1
VVIDVEPQLVRYLAAVHDGERREAINIALALLHQGVSGEQVITDLLAPAQVRIGRYWQEGQWSIAMEHQASAIAESVLRAVVHSAMTAPGAIREGSFGRVVVVCGEGEWHVLPGRMAAEVLRLRGAEVSFLEPSVPADELSGFLGDDPPRVVAVTCSMPISLVGAWRSISALRLIGTTVVCAGQGFGPDGRWGFALGADQWAPDYAAGADILLSRLDKPASAPRDPAGSPERINEVAILGREHEALVAEATRIAVATWPALRHSDAAMPQEDLGATLRAIAAATLVDDVSLVTGYVTWFEALLIAHERPPAFVSTAFDLLLHVLPAGLDCARDTAIAGKDACSAPSLGGDYSR